VTTDYPYGPKEPSKLVKALDIAATIYQPFPDPEDERGPKPTPQNVARWRSEQWESFARDQGFAYIGNAFASVIEEDQRLSAFIADMRQMHLPLNEVGGLIEGVWKGVPFMSFAAFNFGEGGSLWPYRFVCTPLANPGPDLVYDSALQRRRPYHLDWYPQFDGYQLVNGPWKERDEAKKSPGLLGKTAFGRGLSKAIVDAVDDRLAPNLHTSSPERAAVIASRPYESEAFAHSWAARGRWLVVFEAERQQREQMSAAECAALLDSLVAVKRLVD
jgi:hypothetical protein